MNRNGFLVILFTCILILTGCTIINRPAATPIPEKPLAKMTSQPPVGVAGPDSIGDPYIPTLGNSGYDVQQYDLDLTFSSHVDAITATVTISSVVTLDNLGRMSLDFSGYQVDGVQVGRQYAVYYRSPDKLYIDFPKPYATGDELVIRVSYHGQLVSNYSAYSPTTALGLLKPVADENFVFALAEPNGAHSWYPCNDHPQDKAAYRFELTVPKGVTAIANGSLVQTVQSGQQDTFVWSETAPMASYLAMIAVGDYQRIDAPPVGAVKISHYVFEGDESFSNELRKMPAILQFFSDLIAPYPFAELGITIVDPKELSDPFAMESQTMMMFDRDMMDVPSIDFVIAHEVVHQWFGDAVSLASWGEIWLKEGLASYLAMLWLDHAGITTPQDILSGMERGILAFGKIYPLNQPGIYDMYGDNTYAKGPWVYYMLNQELGDEAFIKFVRAYYQRFAGGTASTGDLQHLAEEVSGKNLDAFFQQWVYAVDNPNLKLSWTGQSGHVSVQVCQASGEQLFTLPLELQFRAGTGDSEIQLLPVDEEQEQATYSLPFPVIGLVADPRQIVLASVLVTKVDALKGCAP